VAVAAALSPTPTKLPPPASLRTGTLTPGLSLQSLKDNADAPASVIVLAPPTPNASSLPDGSKLAALPPRWCLYMYTFVAGPNVDGRPSAESVLAEIVVPPPVSLALLATVAGALAGLADRAGRDGVQTGVFRSRSSLMVRDNGFETGGFHGKPCDI